jgi:hypothetical protein
VEAEDGTGGEWKPDKQPDYDETNWYEYAPSGRTQGILCIDENAPEHELVAKLAHELGHACTTQDDLDARQSPEDEWASEWAADWYAVKRWGFGAEIESIRDNRDRLHHGPSPGKPFSTETGDYFLDEDYICHKPS